MKNFAKIWILFSLCLSLAACSSTPTATEQTPTLPETNPFKEQTPTLPETNPFEQPDSGEGGRIGGYGKGFLDPPKDFTFTYDGEPIQLSCYIHGSGSDTEVGLMLFLDGVPQPYQIIKTSQQEDAPETGQEVLMSKHRVSSDGRIEFTVSFTPVTGSAGDELGLVEVTLWEPSFVPKTENERFGLYQSAGFNTPLTVLMKTDAPQQAEDYAAEVVTEPIPPSEKKEINELNPSGRTSPQFNLYTGEFNWATAALFTKNGKIDLALSGWGGIEADYRVTVFVNHQPVSIAGHPNFLLRTHYDQISTYKFTLDVHDYDRLNTLYAVVVPIGQSSKNLEINPWKSTSVLLINDAAAVITPSSK